MNNFIKSELLSDERIIWSGKPMEGRLFNKNDLFLIPFSIMFLGFAIFWESSVIFEVGAPVFFMLWGIPFILMGLYMVFGRFFYKSYLKRHTYYYVTNKRVIILKDTSNRKIEAEYIDSLPSISKDVKGDGSGTITFGNSSGFVGMYQNSGLEFFLKGKRHEILAPAFYDIDDVNKVYQIVSEIRNGTYNDNTL